MRSRAPRQATRGLFAALTTLTLLLLAASPAAASIGPPIGGITPRIGSNTDLVLTGIDAGQNIAGALADADNDDFDPTDGYPDEIPDNFTTIPDRWAGIITGESVQTGEELDLYCIDIRTSTAVGYGYELGTWDASNVRNVGYLARILDAYYPATGEPSEAPDDDARGAAVQAAIWFFSDSYVLQPDDPVRPFTEAIVAAVLEDGTLPEPGPPNLVIDPSAATGPAGAPLGPFVITSDSEDPDLEITVSAEGGSMFSDAAGTVPIADGDSVENGASVWLRPDDTTAGGTVTLSARGVAVVRSGSVYLYDRNTPGVNAAQSVVLAQESEVSSQTTAEATFFEAGSLALTKTIAGPAAGEQDAITVHLSCDNGLEQDIDIPANSPAGDTTTTIDLPLETTCTATEPTDGSSAAITVATEIEGSPATITADQVAEITIINTYQAAGNGSSGGSGGSGGSGAEDAEELADTGAAGGWEPLAGLSAALVLGGVLLLTLERRSRVKVRNRER